MPYRDMRLRILESGHMNFIQISSYDQGALYRDFVSEHGSPLLVLDVQRVREQYYALQQALPGVQLHYALKSFPHPAIVSLLDHMGAFFDLASSGEIELVEGLHISGGRTIHSHPIKRDKDIRDALRFGCNTFVVDNTEELLKFIPYKDRAELLIRLSFRSQAAIVDLSKKFGCTPEEAGQMLSLASRMGIHIKGLSFHVGSQCSNSQQQVKAIEVCNTLIRRSATHSTALRILDIGGGFPVAYDNKPVDIDGYCAPIRRALAALPRDVEVIAEPGRFISGPAMTCIASVIGKAQRSGMRWYYLDEGVYGSFSGQIFDHVRYPLEIFSDAATVFPSVLAGPTCDSIDLIAEDVSLPELKIGDILAGHMMGAYTAASATEFNSLPKAEIVVYDRSAANMLFLPSSGAQARRRMIKGH
jgi:ornithine decarboxylase